MTSELLTSRLHLRQLSLVDEGAVIKLRTNPKIFHWRTPDTSQEAAQWLRDRLADPLSLIFTIKVLVSAKNTEAEPTIGMMGLLREVGYMFDPDHWGKGYATEALQALLDDYWRKYPKGHPLLANSDDQLRLIARTGSETEAAASRRVLQKCGFTFDGNQEEREGDAIVVQDRWILPRPSDDP